jgi:membrane carboxypeptidase/penicillin-binding protein PbpC
VEDQISRRFHEDLFKEREPERYELLLESYHCLDTTSWKTGRSYEYKDAQTTHFIPSVTRVFKLAK